MVKIYRSKKDEEEEVFKNTQKNHIKNSLKIFFFLKKGHNDPNNHDGVVIHLEPDILEYEVKRALGSITMNKASGGDRIPAELFKILKGDAVKVLHSLYLKIWKTH